MDQEVKRQLRSLDSKVTKLVKESNQKPRTTLVKVGIIKGLTGLNKDGLRRARQSNLVKQVKINGEIFYELESLHEILILKDRRLTA